tara:strand:+ start:235 stop:531 length:297 start_codon:yes stop_codon:yes gene_type:complete
MSKINHDTSQPNIFLVNLGLILSCVLIGIIFIWCFYYYKAAISVEKNQKELTDKPLSRQELEVYEEETLNTLKWKDKEKGTVQVPLSEARRLILKKYN